MGQEHELAWTASVAKDEKAQSVRKHMFLLTEIQKGETTKIKQLCGDGSVDFVVACPSIDYSMTKHGSRTCVSLDDVPASDMQSTINSNLRSYMVNLTENQIGETVRKLSKLGGNGSFELVVSCPYGMIQHRLRACVSLHDLPASVAYIARRAAICANTCSFLLRYKSVRLVDSFPSSVGMVPWSWLFPVHQMIMT